MAGLAILFLIACLGLLLRDGWRRTLKAELRIQQKHHREPTKRQIERDNLKTKMKLRNLRAEIMRWYITHPKYRNNLKLLIRKELEVTQMLKGLKRRTISDIKYEKIKQAAETGTFDKDVLDMING